MMPLRIDQSLTLPAHELSFVAMRSSGAGGQNVNKVASKVELRFDPKSSSVLTQEVKARLKKLAARYLDAEGQIRVTSQKTRDQSRNLEDAREKLAQLIRKALIPPKKRIPTKPTKGAKERRLQDKQRTAERKRERRNTQGDG